MASNSNKMQSRGSATLRVVYKQIYNSMAITLQWIMQCIKLHSDNLQGRFNGLQGQHDGSMGQCYRIQVIAVVYRAIVMTFT